MGVRPPRLNRGVSWTEVRVEFHYSLGGTGWATATVANDGKSVSMPASYLHDSLRDLAKAVLRLRDGESEALVIFVDEPGEHHLTLRRLSDDVTVEVQRTNLWTNGKPIPPGEGRTLFEARVPFSELQRAVLTALDDLMSSLGVVRYKEKWVEHDFPTAEYQQLRAS